MRFDLRVCEQSVYNVLNRTRDNKSLSYIQDNTSVHCKNEIPCRSSGRYEDEEYNRIASVSLLTLLCCGNANKALCHNQDYNDFQTIVLRMVLCDALGELYSPHFRFSHHTSDKCNCHVLIQSSQKPDIQDYEILLFSVELNRPSNSDEVHLCHEQDFSCPLQQIWQSLRGLGVCLWAFPLRRRQSWLLSLVNKAYLKLLVSLFYWQRFWLLLRDAMRDCQSYFSEINQVVYPYFNYSILRIGSKP